MSEPVQERSPFTPASGPATGCAWAVQRIAARAHGYDSLPRFPAANFADLNHAGLLAAPAGGYIAETELVRAVAAADASTARILDGHFNALERLTLAADGEELDAWCGRGLLLGVWGADPSAGEGPPARLVRSGSGWVIDGVKTFCSGAGGVDRALVVAGADDGTRRLVYIDANDSRVEVDPYWYQASGLRASESHRVWFREVPVLALLGGPDELAREPYFSRDAIRTVATWVGLVDAILEEVTALLADQPLTELEAYRLGQMRVAAGTIERWYDHTVGLLADALDVVELPTPGAAEPAARRIPAAALECRVALSQCARMILTVAAELCGSRALIGESRLDRARRDLDLFLLQHRLDRKLADLGIAFTGGHQL